MDANGGATIDNIQIGISGDNEIDTSTGNLTIDSAGGTTTIDDILIVSGATTLQSTLNVTGTSTFSSAVTFSGSLNLNDAGLELYRSGGAYIDMRQLTTEDFNIRLDNFTSNVLRLSSLTGTAELRVTGDIIAFVSDERLKTNIKSIDNALDKVVSLNGFTYTFNELAASLGFDPNQVHAGVSAQQVQSVLPEAIASCPIDDNYLTVKYEKLVPLLIEAIKELKNEVDELKKINRSGTGN